MTIITTFQFKLGLYPVCTVVIPLERNRQDIFAKTKITKGMRPALFYKNRKLR